MSSGREMGRQMGGRAGDDRIEGYIQWLHEEPELK